VQPDRRTERCTKLLARLEAEDLEGFLVFHLPNVRYLTGFTGSAGYVLLTGERTIFVSDFRYREQADVELGGLAEIEIAERDTVGRLLDLIRDLRLRRIGFESHIVTAATARRLTEMNGGVSFQPCEGFVEDLRASKDAAEVASIRAAATLAHEALAETIEKVSPGMRELDVALTLESALRRRGSEWHPFQTIVASGPRSALPHARTTERVIQPGEWLLVDFGAQVDGYCADLTRTYVVGHADERQRMVYGLTQDAQQRALTHVRAGITGKEADGLARSVIESRGFGEAFGHSLGHGLGLEVHEGPRLSQSNDEPLPVDAVVTIEPGVYFPGWGGVRIEDDVRLTMQGAELLSNGQTGLQEL
jgi:Xaa-Pro aminopeptidase